MKSRRSFITSTFIRTFVFGVEDSLVSTVGLLSGVAIAGVPPRTIFLTGLVLIFVEAISMGAGSFLSESSAQQFSRKREVHTTGALMSGIIMVASYFFAGFIPLLPYTILDVRDAFVVSIIFSIISLFILGVIGAKLSRVNLLRNGLRMALVGGLAIAVGITVGKLVG